MRRRTRKRNIEDAVLMNVSFLGEQRENIQTALKKAEIMTGSDALPWLLDCICMAFNAEAFSSKEEALEVMCQRIERVYGVEILALHSKKKRVVFGERLTRIANMTNSHLHMDDLPDRWESQ